MRAQSSEHLGAISATPTPWGHPLLLLCCAAALLCCLPITCCAHREPHGGPTRHRVTCGAHAPGLRVAGSYTCNEAPTLQSTDDRNNNERERTGGERAVAGHRVPMGTEPRCGLDTARCGLDTARCRPRGVSDQPRCFAPALATGGSMRLHGRTTTLRPPSAGVHRRIRALSANTKLEPRRVRTIQRAETLRNAQHGILGYDSTCAHLA